MIDPRLWQAVVDEHDRQQQKHGPQNYPGGNGSDGLWVIMDQVRTLCSIKTSMGTVTWSEVLLEETLESLAETDPVKLERELVQVATVALAWATRLRQGTVPAGPVMGQQ